MPDFVDCPNCGVLLDATRYFDEDELLEVGKTALGDVCPRCAAPLTFTGEAIIEYDYDVALASGTDAEAARAKGFAGFDFGDRIACGRCGRVHDFDAQQTGASLLAAGWLPGPEDVYTMRPTGPCCARYDAVLEANRAYAEALNAAVAS